MEKKKVVFLYTEIAGYFLACCKELVAENVEVHVVRYPLNKEAPFQFSFPDGMKVYERNKYDDAQLVTLIQEINPSVIVCSGWIDKGYLRICRKFKGRIPTILTLDNHWYGNIKQQIARIISPLFLLTRFSHCWVPGKLQEEYALRLGFKKANILAGFYSCDFDFFYDQYQANKHNKEKEYPKRFIYVGRYYEFKGIKDLWTAFIELQNEFPNEWELWCLGTGDIDPVEHPKIRHFGFVQPKDLPAFIKDTGVFILPSHFEPWGVVVHEFAAAGFPLVCSDEVGARTAFVENNYNGYIYKSGDVQALKAVMFKIIRSDENELVTMSKNSAERAKQITPETWSKQLVSFLS